MSTLPDDKMLLQRFAEELVGEDLVSAKRLRQALNTLPDSDANKMMFRLARSSSKQVEPKQPSIPEKKERVPQGVAWQQIVTCMQKEKRWMSNLMIQNATGLLCSPISVHLGKGVKDGTLKKKEITPNRWVYQLQEFKES